MARRPNYGFQKQKKEIERQKKREEKAAKKQAKDQVAQADVQSGTDPQDHERT